MSIRNKILTLTLSAALIAGIAVIICVNTPLNGTLFIVIAVLLILGGAIAVFFASVIAKPVGGDILEIQRANEELRQSHNFISTVIDNINDGLLIINVDDFSIAGTNRTFLTESGFEKDEVIGRKCHEVTHIHSYPCTTPDDTCPLIETRKTGRQAATTHIHYTRDGDKRYVEVSTSPIFDIEGRLTQVVHVTKDITKRQQAEENLRENQRELIEKHEELNALFKKVEIVNIERQKIMDSMGDMIILTDHEGTIKRINKAVQFFSRMSYDAIIETSWENFLSDSDLQATTLYEGCTELTHPPSGKWFELNAYPYEDIDLHTSGNVITIHETTELKKVTAELEQHHRISNENREKLQSALDQISILMQNVTKRTDTSIRLSNDHLLKCYEVKNCKKEDCACYGKEATRCWQIAGTYCGGKVQGAFAQKYQNCSECNVFQAAIPDSIYQIGEHFNNMMHVLEIKNRELEGAYSELKNTQAQILQREKMASIGQVAAGVAHEINNPTGFIMSNLGTLRKYAERLSAFIEVQTRTIESLNAGDCPDELKETKKKLKLDYILADLEMLIKESLDGAERIKQIVQNLKSFSRVDEAEFKYSDINECIESTLNIVWNELKYKATIKKDYGDLPKIKCYPQQLNQVFMNLLVNSAHAIEKQGEIVIKTWNGDGALHISISDTGSGIPEDKIKKIFEPFFTTKPVGKGTGLGLSITYDIIKKHNGEITVSSEEGKGTEFTIKLPLEESNE